MKILSWNILHGGGSRVTDIVGRIEHHDPDVVCLQEFRHGKSTQPLSAGFAEIGLSHSHMPPTDTASINTVAYFSRHALTTEDHFVDKKAAVRCSEARLLDDTWRILNVSFPHKKEQIPLFELLLNLGESYTGQPTLLIGDFNCGIPFEDSETKTFYATHLFQQLLKQGWIDSWRSRNPQKREFSWYSTRKGNGFRYDHALVSAPLNGRIDSVVYDHSARELGISDHSPLIVKTVD